MITIASWHGTHQESLELVNAVASNCACELGDMGEHLTVCQPHWMLASDQRALDGLLFVRRMAERLKREELSGATSSAGYHLAADGRERLLDGSGIIPWSDPAFLPRVVVPPVQ